MLSSIAFHACNRNAIGLELVQCFGNLSLFIVIIPAVVQSSVKKCSLLNRLQTLQNSWLNIFDSICEASTTISSVPVALFFSAFISAHFTAFSKLPSLSNSSVSGCHEL